MMSYKHAVKKANMNKAIQIIKWTIICVIFVLVFGFVVMTLWNWLLPRLFNLPAINFWQALGLLLLSKILFGGFRGGHWGGHNRQWKQRYYNKMAHMSPEERERFKSRVWEKWCSEKKSAERSDSSANV
jgi:hypothetical protein